MLQVGPVCVMLMCQRRVLAKNNLCHLVPFWDQCVQDWFILECMVEKLTRKKSFIWQSQHTCEVIICQVTLSECLSSSSVTQSISSLCKWAEPGISHQDGKWLISTRGDWNIPQLLCRETSEKVFLICSKVVLILLASQSLLKDWWTHNEGLYYLQGLHQCFLRSPNR